MSGQKKQVHWDDTRYARSPSPALSVSSQGSSVGPFTPPMSSGPLPPVQVAYPTHPSYGAYLVVPEPPYMKHHPYPGSPASSVSSSGTSSPYGPTVHPFLAKSSHAAPQTAPFVWDLTLTATHMRMHYPPPSDLFDQPATTPPTASLVIRCKFLPWEMHVSPKKGIPFVTIGDVIDKIQTDLRLVVSPQELGMVYTGGAHVKAGVEHAYAQRLSRSPDRRAEEKRGVRRVDVLMGMINFAGLTAVQDPHGKPNVFMLSVRPPLA